MKPITIIDAHSHLGEFTTTRKRADGATLSTLFEKSRLTHGVTFSIEACYGAVDLGNGYAVNQVVAQARLSAMIVPTEASARWIQQAAQNPIIVGIQPWANTMFSEPASCA